MTDGSNRAEQRDSTSFDDVRQARIDELCHQLKREIKALNDERMARLNEALASAGA
ncbi:hypothetical protein [Burkholderia multivorans]|uniref:hypothetical protein n=1 Tax=Burkholderia multivorans TaxID=87883 RepID=UPI0019032BB8|nr:hypothetical protein [Burkholderia multivorans]MBJ9658334.1 hypothetical protein [Burkholderia multivorans]MCO7336028.1 hypothetical protein [Burkholderia multivorans]HDR9337697.1 hypothetical protein [Burkholderia multivorans]